MWPLPLFEVVLSFGGRLSSSEDTYLNSETSTCGIAINTASVEKDFVFIALPGSKVHGAQFISEAKDKGAVGCITDMQGLEYVKDIKNFPIFISDDLLGGLRNFASHFRSQLEAPVIAIGGSNGKTTTKEMVVTLLKESLLVSSTQKSENGFLGIPLTLCQPSHTKDAQFGAHVIEVGIDAIGSMEQHRNLVKPDWVILTALGEEHLLGLKTLENCITEELKLFDLEKSDVSEVNRIWNFCLEPLSSLKYGKPTPGDVIVTESEINLDDFPFISVFSFKSKTELMGSHVHWNYRNSQDDLTGEFFCPLPGIHNAQNLCLAYAMGLALGVPVNVLDQGIGRLGATDGRSKILTLPSGTIVYNDTYNANPLSMELGLKTVLSLNRFPMTLILGDMLELGDFSESAHKNLCSLLLTFSDTFIGLYGNAMKDLFIALSSFKQDLQKNNITLRYFEPTRSPVSLLEDLPKNCSLFFAKGSRSMGLDKLVDAYIHGGHHET